MRILDPGTGDTSLCFCLLVSSPRVFSLRKEVERVSFIPSRKKRRKRVRSGGQDGGVRGLRVGAGMGFTIPDL